MEGGREGGMEEGRERGRRVCRLTSSSERRSKSQSCLLMASPVPWTSTVGRTSTSGGRQKAKVSGWEEACARSFSEELLGRMEEKVDARGWGD